MIYFKDKNNAHQILSDVINLKFQIPYKDRVSSLADDYKTAITGEGYERWLNRFEKRELTEDFNYRISVTSKTFKSSVGNVLNTFNKLTAIKDIQKFFGYVDESETKEQDSHSLNEKVNYMFGNSYEDFVRTHLLPKSHRDPNSFYIVLFEKNGKEVVPYLKYVTNEESVYYKYKNNRLDFLVIKEEIITSNRKAELFEADDYTIYAGDTIIEYKLYLRADKKSDDETANYENSRANLPETDVPDFIDNNKNKYKVYEYKTGCSRVQAYRCGYKMDPYTDEKTCVAIWEDAMPVVKRLVDVISQSDVSRAEHAYPKFLTYYSACNYSSDEKGQCEGGKFPDQTTCPKCEGSGRQSFKTELDKLQVEFPEDVSDIFDVGKMASYVNLPINGIEFFDKLEQRLERRLFAAVFNAEMSPHSSLTAVGDSVTATEVTTTRSDIVNTLILTANFISNFVKFVYEVSSDYMNKGKKRNLVLNYIFPNDLKLSSVEDLLNQLKLADEASAPNFIIEELSNGIARKLYEGDFISTKRMQKKKLFIPFFEKPLTFVESGMKNGLIREDDAILYYNQESIFVDLENKNIGIYFKPESKQDELIELFIKDFLTKFKDGKKVNGEVRKDNSKIENTIGN